MPDLTVPQIPFERKPRLLDQVHEAIRRLHYSRRTEDAYVHWIKRFIFWTGKRHPSTVGAAEVTAFFSHLALLTSPLDRGDAVSAPSPASGTPRARQPQTGYRVGATV